MGPSHVACSELLVRLLFIITSLRILTAVLNAKWHQASAVSKAYGMFRGPYRPHTAPFRGRDKGHLIKHVVGWTGRADTCRGVAGDLKLNP